MKLVSFVYRGRLGVGAVVGEGVVDLGARMPRLRGGLRALIGRGLLGEVREAAEGAAPDLALSDITLLPVIPDPTKILCIGVNYVAHRQETGRKPVDHPTVFTRFADTLAAHGEPLVRPAGSGSLDFEGELAVVIGTGGRAIRPEDALSHIAGYACFNDGSVRDWQRHTSQFTPGKNFPKTGGFGPWLTTADAVADVRALTIETRVNGQAMQSAGLDMLIFDIPAIIAYCSAFTPLRPGDVIATGTPGGVGERRDPPVFLQPGDTVEVEIPGVGLLRNGVAEGPAL